MSGVRSILSDIFLSVEKSFNSLALPHPTSKLPGEDITVTGSEHSPAVFEAPPELSCIVVPILVEGGPLPALHKR